MLWGIYFWQSLEKKRSMTAVQVLPPAATNQLMWFYRWVRMHRDSWTTSKCLGVPHLAGKIWDLLPYTWVYLQRSLGLRSVLYRMI